MNLVDLQTLAAVSILTTLTTEAFKIMFDKLKVTYISNVIAALVSIILSVVIVVVYPYVNGEQITSQIIFSGVATAFCGMLTSMIGYDKVLETLQKLKK